jgi:hypothetical protein
MPLTIVEADSFPSALQAPAAGELASAPVLLSLFLQGAANRLRWLYNRVNKFVVGGAFTPSDTLSIDTPSTKALWFNGTAYDSTVDGGDVRPYGATLGKHSVAAVSSVGVSATIPYYTEWVYVGGFGAPVTAGFIWQVATPPNGSATRCWVMTLSNSNGSSIVVKDAGGATLATIANLSGSPRSVTISYDGSSWVVIDVGWRP